MDKYERCAATEKAEGFDRGLAEAVLNEILEGREVYGSCVPGVIAFERDSSDWDTDWNDVARRLSKAVGVRILVAANCDWTFDDRPHDEEAVLIAFDIPSCPQDYRDDCRNMVGDYEEPEAAAAPAP